MTDTTDIQTYEMTRKMSKVLVIIFKYEANL